MNIKTNQLCKIAKKTFGKCFTVRPSFYSCSGKALLQCVRELKQLIIADIQLYVRFVCYLALYNIDGAAYVWGGLVLIEAHARVCVCACARVCLWRILLSFTIPILSIKSYLNGTGSSHVVYQNQTSVMYSEGLEFFSECHQNSLCISRLPHFTCISSPSQPFVFLRFFNYTF
jgi:hypothetical protein